MNELNPNHEVVRAAEDQWHKIVFIIMRKLGLDSIEINMDNVHRVVADSDKLAVCLDCRSHGKAEPTMTVRIMSLEEAERLAREEGGLPC